MTYKQQSKASPLKRIRLARGLTMAEIAHYAHVTYPTVQIIDRLEPKKVTGGFVGPGENGRSREHRACGCSAPGNRLDVAVGFHRA